MYNDPALLPWLQAIRDHAGGFDLFDAHVHFGIDDPSGLLATEEEARGALELVDSRALMFPLKEPSGYADANQRALALARESRGRIRALARLDPARDPAGEAERCLRGGAVGIKLHPRGEGFEIGDERLDRAFELVSDAGGLVMMHAATGFGGAQAQQALDRARRYPGARLVFAHCAISDLAWIGEPVRALPNVYFDTSWWNPSDVFALFRTVPPSRILYASDIPFGAPVFAAMMTARIAMTAGLDSRQVRSVMGQQLECLLEHREPLELGPPAHEPFPLHPLMERLYVTLVGCIEGLLRGEDAGQGLELALDACKVPARSELAGAAGAIRELLEGSRQMTDRDPLRHGRAPGHDLVLTAAVAARTAGLPVPEQSLASDMSNPETAQA